MLNEIERELLVEAKNHLKLPEHKYESLQGALYLVTIDKCEPVMKEDSPRLRAYDRLDRYIWNALSNPYGLEYWQKQMGWKRTLEETQQDQIDWIDWMLEGDARPKAEKVVLDWMGRNDVVLKEAAFNELVTLLEKRHA